MGIHCSRGIETKRPSAGVTVAMLILIAALLVCAAVASPQPPGQLPYVPNSYSPIAFLGKVIDVQDYAVPKKHGPPGGMPYLFSIATIKTQKVAVGEPPDTLRLLQRTVVAWKKDHLTIAVHEGQHVLYKGDEIVVVALQYDLSGRYPWSEYDPVWTSEYVGFLREYGASVDPKVFTVREEPRFKNTTPADVETPVRDYIQRVYEDTGMTLTGFLEDAKRQYGR
jgi:hypothetical protein